MRLFACMLITALNAGAMFDDERQYQHRILNDDKPTIIEQFIKRLNKFDISRFWAIYITLNKEKPYEKDNDYNISYSYESCSYESRIKRRSNN